MKVRLRGGHGPILARLQRLRLAVALLVKLGAQALVPPCLGRVLCVMLVRRLLLRPLPPVAQE